VKIFHRFFYECARTEVIGSVIRLLQYQIRSVQFLALRGFSPTVIEIRPLRGRKNCKTGSSTLQQSRTGFILLVTRHLLLVTIFYRQAIPKGILTAYSLQPTA
jgi:hypothetical protein